MKRTLTVAVLALLAAASVAQEPNLDETVALVLRDAGATEVLGLFGTVLSVEVQIDPEIAGPLTIHLEGVRARTALQAVCEILGCRWRIEEGVLHFAAIEPLAESASPPSRETEPLSLDLQEADAGDLFRSLAQILVAELDLDPKVDGKLTIQLDKASLEEVLEKICAVLECVSEVVVDGDRRTLAVRPQAAG